MNAGTVPGSRLAIGIAGLGSVGMRLGEELRVNRDASIVAVTDIDPGNVESAAEVFEVPEDGQFERYEAMLDEADLDAVVIATPNGLHYEQAMAALDRDLNVLLEKPIATDVEDAMDLTERAEQSDNVVMLGFQRHLNPSFIEGHQRWRQGDAEPTFITGELTHDWRDYFDEMDDWRMNPDLSGGGHLINVGIHVIEAILWMTGLTPINVDAHVSFHDDAEILDKESSFRIEFENGTIATITDTGLATRAREHVHLWDDDGALYIDGREWNERHGYTIDNDGTEHDPYRGGSQGKADAFVETVQNGDTPPSTARDALWGLVVTLATYKSGRRDEPVDVFDLYPGLTAFER
ncbi:Gfo/Idh/MocA family protein [Haloarchaeobius sp. DYHT-AS-18]|uniref:Gfo/Idh/MocA family protein n=1 Tax=Haloarchaeobius sp. DYHT-AS-18 TaxID=3446117 RepID=UPI003EB7E112